MPVVAIVVLLALAAQAPASNAAFKAPTKSCAKLKGSAQKQCKRQNKANRTLFSAISGYRFAGRLSNGVGIDATFCKSGKWLTVVTFSSGEAREFKGSKWQLRDADINPQRPSWLAAEARGPSNNIYTRVYLQRRGAKWHFFRGNWMANAGAEISRTPADPQVCT